MTKFLDILARVIWWTPSIIAATIIMWVMGWFVLLLVDIKLLLIIIGALLLIMGGQLIWQWADRRLYPPNEHDPTIDQRPGM